LKNTSDFATGGDSTLTAPSISVDQYTELFHLTNDQLNSGIRMDDLLTSKLFSLGSAILKVATAPVTIANFNQLAPLVQIPDAFGFGDLGTLWGRLKRAAMKNLVIDGEYLARIINVPSFFQQAGLGSGGGWGAFGWNGVFLNTEWSGADANVRGLACHPQAVGIIGGLPLNPVEGIPGNIIQVGQGMLPGVNLSIATYLWMDANARTMRGSFDLMFGSTLVDASAGCIIKSQ